MSMAKSSRRASRVAPDAIDAAEEAQVLDHREVVVERELLRHVADVLAHPLGLARDVEARDGRSSAARPQEAAQHADGRRFARAVGAEEADDLAPPRLEAHVVDGDEIAEALDETVGDDPDLAFGGARSLPLVLRRAARRTGPRSKARCARSRPPRRPRRLSAAASSAFAPLRVVDDGVHAVAHQDRVLDAGAIPPRRRAPVRASARRDRENLARHQRLQRAGVSQ